MSYIGNTPESLNLDGGKDLFIAGTHYTKNVSTSVTLSAVPAKPNSVKVFFNGVYQNKDTYYLVGSTINFGIVGTPDVIDVDSIEVQYEIPSQFVGLNAADQAVLTAAVSSAISSANTAVANATASINVASALSAPGGSALVGYQGDGIGAQSVTVSDKIGQEISLLDFIPKSQWAAIKAGTSVYDATSAVQAAFDSAVDGTEIKVPYEIICAGPLVISAPNVTLRGFGGYSKSMLRFTTPGIQALTVTSYGFKTFGLVLRGDGGSNGAGATINGVKFLRADGSKDVDAELIDTTITGFSQPVSGQGTNLHVSGCLISSSLGGVKWARNGVDECRGVRVTGTRFHSIGTIGLAAKCVELPADAFDCEVNNNFCDSIYSFYEGPINGITVDNNLCYRVAGPGVNVLAATYTTQQRCGSVNFNTLYCNSPSYVGSGITLRMQNAQAIGNKVIGPRGHGIHLISTTGSIVTENAIVSPNFNVGEDGAIYDGICADVGSTANLVFGNHVRTAGVVGRSAINIASSNNIVMGNWVDPLYPVPYFADLPLIIPSTTGFGVKKVPARSFDLLGRAMRIQQPDAVTGNPVEYQASFTGAGGAEIQSSTIKTVVRSSSAGVEKADVEFWTMTNGAMVKQATINWNGGLTLPALAAPPSGPVIDQMAMSDGTAGSASWGASGRGLYRWNGSAWVFVG